MVTFAVPSTNTIFSACCIASVYGIGQYPIFATDGRCSIHLNHRSLDGCIVITETIHEEPCRIFTKFITDC